MTNEGKYVGMKSQFCDGTLMWWKEGAKGESRVKEGALGAFTMRDPAARPRYPSASVFYLQVSRRQAVGGDRCKCKAVTRI